jgi:ABC-type glycerol-3-phosphate transport system substrate-binding protein
MQWFSEHSPLLNRFRPGAKRLPVYTAILALFLPGCADRPTTIDQPTERTREGIVLTVAAPEATPGGHPDADPVTRELLSELAASWKARTGGTLKIVPGDLAEDADFALIPPRDLPRLADSGRLALLPAAYTGPTHPFRFDEIVAHYLTRSLVWKDKLYALPVVAEGMVLLYDKSAFEPARVPKTWEEIIAQARKRDPGNLPPLTGSPKQIDVLFHTIASSYDRKPVGRVAIASSIKMTFFSFDFDADTGAPRIADPAFVASATILQQWQALADTASRDAVESFQKGKAKIGVVTLAELARIASDETIASRLGVAGLPGTMSPFDDDGKPTPSNDGSVSRVPYHGYGGLIGVVSAKSPHAEAAWALLADLAGPDRGSPEMIAAGKWGAGVMRGTQLDPKARSRWYGYHLPHDETIRLMDALRDDLGTGIQNSRYALRTPNQHEFTRILGERLQALLKNGGDPKAALQGVAKDWDILIAPLGRDWLRLYRLSLGL